MLDDSQHGGDDDDGKIFGPLETGQGDRRPTAEIFAARPSNAADDACVF